MLVSGVPKLNKVDTCEAVRITLYIAKFETLPLKKPSEPPLFKILIVSTVGDLSG